jgi:hypothetical protein
LQQEIERSRLEIAELIRQIKALSKEREVHSGALRNLSSQMNEPSGAGQGPITEEHYCKECLISRNLDFERVCALTGEHSKACVNCGAPAFAWAKKRRAPM